jgi:prepilin-type N-terminal cleavage/methylation domain-containing protein
MIDGKRNRGKTGFTLIELLVVIAVIGILAALLLATLSRAKEEAYTTYCKNNLRQWGVALRMYVDDFNVYPPCEMKDQESSDALSLFWHQRLQFYTHTKEPSGNFGYLSPPVDSSVYVCPSYLRLGGACNGTSMGSYGYNESGYGALNGQLGLGAVMLDDAKGFPVATDQTAGPSDVRLVREAEVVAPSDMIAVGDATLGGLSGPPNPNFFGLSDLDVQPNVLVLLSINDPSLTALSSNIFTVYAVAGMTKRHAGIWNVVFCDGHVEGLQAKALWYPTDSVSQRWNRDHQPHPAFFLY